MQQAYCCKQLCRIQLTVSESIEKFAFVGTASVMHQQVCCVQLSMSADNMALPARLLLRAVLWRGCCNRPIFPARRAHSSKPAAAAGE